MIDGVTAVCGGGYCDRPAVAVVYPRIGGSTLIRTDLLGDPKCAADARCLDCLLAEVENNLGPPDPT